MDPFILYSISLSPDSDVVKFSKRSANLHAPSEIAHIGSHASKIRESVHVLTCCTSSFYITFRRNRNGEYFLPSIAIGNMQHTPFHGHYYIPDLISSRE